MIRAIIESIGSVIAKVATLAANIGLIWSSLLGLFIICFLTPLNWGFSVFLDLLGVVSTASDTVLALLARLQINQISVYWGSVLYYAGIADNFIPVALGVYIGVGLFSLWVISMKIRLILWLARKLLSILPGL